MQWVFHLSQELYDINFQTIDDYAKDGGEELFTKVHCVLITNP